MSGSSSPAWFVLCAFEALTAPQMHKEQENRGTRDVVQSTDVPAEAPVGAMSREGIAADPKVTPAVAPMRTSPVTSHCCARYATRTSVTLANFVNSGRANENRCHTDTRSTPRRRPRGDSITSPTSYILNQTPRQWTRFESARPHVV